MPRSPRVYPAEFRRQLVELVHAGRTPHALAQEFEPSEQTIRNWVAQAERDTGQRHDGLTTAERREFTAPPAGSAAIEVGAQIYSDFRSLPGKLSKDR